MLRRLGRPEEEQKMEQEMGWDDKESLLEGQQGIKVEVKQEVHLEKNEMVVEMRDGYDGGTSISIFGWEDMTMLPKGCLRSSSRFRR